MEEGRACSLELSLQKGWYFVGLSFQQRGDGGKGCSLLRLHRLFGFIYIRYSKDSGQELQRGEYLCFRISGIMYAVHVTLLTHSHHIARIDAMNVHVTLQL